MPARWGSLRLLGETAKHTRSSLAGLGTQGGPPPDPPPPALIQEVVLRLFSRPLLRGFLVFPFVTSVKEINSFARPRVNRKASCEQEPPAHCQAPARTFPSSGPVGCEEEKGEERALSRRSVGSLVAT